MLNIVSTFTPEMIRIAANLQQRYDAWVFAIRDADSLPSSMYWINKPSGSYLAVKKNSGDNGTTVGAKNEETEKTYSEYQSRRAAAEKAVQDTGVVLADIIRSYKDHKLPMAMERPATILRELDIEGLLGTDLLTVGTNAFCAYEIEAGCKFSAGISDETDDFDLSWCRGSDVSLSKTSDRPVGSPLMRVLKRIDPSYRINKGKPYQALDSTGYEVELLAAPSVFRTLAKNEVFVPMPIFFEQEWLLKGRPVRHVIVSRDAKACPIFAPDPRWMALHKLWLAEKPERNANKKPKDKTQGDALLDLVMTKMKASYPLDTDFIMDIPDELRRYFDRWANERGFVRQKPGFSLR